jgi:exonuclease III
MLKHAPLVACLNETWLLKNDNDIVVPGYHYFGRPRVTPGGRGTISGGVGILVKAVIPFKNIRLLPYEDEGGSTGSIFVEITLPDSSTFVVGTTYSETDTKESLMGLDMPAVWKKRGRTVGRLLTDDPSRLVIWGGDFNVHVGNLQEAEGMGERETLLPIPSATQQTFAEPFRELATALPMVLLNGRVGGTQPTWYPSFEAAGALKPQEVMKATSHRPSVLDLVMMSERHRWSHAESLEVTRVDDRWSDHRPVILNLRLPCAASASGLADTGSAPAAGGEEQLPRDFYKDEESSEGFERGRHGGGNRAMAQLLGGEP